MLVMFLRLCPLLASLLVFALAEPGGSRTPELPGSCLAGVPGIPGHHGAPGRDGRDGEKGVTGSKGEPGIPGSKGADGDKGAPGKFGPSGGAGPIGPPGPRGSKGDEGGSPAVPKSAFTAKISSSNPPAGSPIKFDVIISNDQNHYDPLSGKFTCVHPGLYYFVMHAHVYKHDLCVALIKDDNRVVSFCSNNIENRYANAISGGSVLSLKAGDHVWLQVVEAYNGMFSQPGYRDSSFTGFLLFPD